MTGQKGYLRGFRGGTERVLGHMSHRICMQNQGRCFEAFVLDNVAPDSKGRHR